MVSRLNHHKTISTFVGFPRNEGKSEERAAFRFGNVFGLPKTRESLEFRWRPSPLVTISQINLYIQVYVYGGAEVSARYSVKVLRPLPPYYTWPAE